MRIPRSFRSLLLSGIMPSAVFFSGCGRGSLPEAAPPGPSPPPATTEWTVEASDRLYRDDSAVLPDSAIHQIIRDPTSFSRAWRQATSGRAEPPSMPSVDFTRDMVVFVSAGRSDPGDRIRVESWGIRREADARRPDQDFKVIYVVVRVIRADDPFPGDSYPMEMVLVERHELPVRWDWEDSG